MTARQGFGTFRGQTLVFFMRLILRVFFRLLYHQFAFAYNLVAAAVSFNRWKDWVGSAVPFIEGRRILEIGHGPGLLQRILLGRGLTIFGIDESREMGFLAKRRTDGSARLARGLAQYLPYPDSSFDTIISTFPSEYIYDPRTLAEAMRCLSNGGRFVVLPVALPKNPFLDWLYKVTGESPSETEEVIIARLRKPFEKAGFETEVRTHDAQSSRLFIVIARRNHVEEIS
jgi:ubiquinone/menaquinone biosynthesis C-methylase UbiE